MIKILFICYANICRSVMAEAVMRDMLDKSMLSDLVEVDSAATSTEEIGNKIYPPAKKELASHGLENDSHRARQLVTQDYWDYNMLIGMDDTNIRDINSICKTDISHKIYKLLDYVDSRKGENISDPWYTRDFKTCYDDIYEGCKSLMSAIRNTI